MTKSGRESGQDHITGKTWSEYTRSDMNERAANPLRINRLDSRQVDFALPRIRPARDLIRVDDAARVFSTLRDHSCAISF